MEGPAKHEQNIPQPFPQLFAFQNQEVTFILRMPLELLNVKINNQSREQGRGTQGILRKALA